MVMIIFINPPFNYLIAVIGIFALIDDILGRVHSKRVFLEIGQLSRGIGMLIVAVLGFSYFGPASILIALMIQPINIADMQPGTACSTVIIMCVITITLMILTGFSGFIVPLIILAACIGYAPLDYKGEIMMGEIGNHSFAVGLGISYAFLGGFLGSYSGVNIFVSEFLVTLSLLILTSIIIAALRRKNLEVFIYKKLGIKNPYFGDYVMDVLTGGGLGDLVRHLLIGKREIKIKRQIFKYLGFRRLVYNPHAYK